MGDDGIEPSYAANPCQGAGALTNKLITLFCFIVVYKSKWFNTKNKPNICILERILSIQFYCYPPMPPR